VPAKYTVAIRNPGNNTTLAVYDAGLLVGTVTKRSNRSLKSFTMTGNDTIVVKNENNVQIGTFTMPTNNTTTFTCDTSCH
jgi:hypothetical protein